MATESRLFTFLNAIYINRIHCTTPYICNDRCSLLLHLPQFKPQFTAGVNVYGDGNAQSGCGPWKDNSVFSVQAQTIWHPTVLEQLEILLLADWTKNCGVQQLIYHRSIDGHEMAPMLSGHGYIARNGTSENYQSAFSSCCFATW